MIDKLLKSSFSYYLGGRQSAMNSESLRSALADIAETLYEVSFQVEGMARDIKELVFSEDRGLLLEAPIIRLKDLVLGFKAGVENAAELIPQTHSPFEVPWIGKKRDKLRLEYVSGDDPWEFYLGYRNDKRVLQHIEETIKEKHSKGILKKSLPEEGKFVLCSGEVQGRRTGFRAIVIQHSASVGNGSQSVRVYSVDTGESSCVSSDDVYSIPEGFTFIPCRVIRCCLDTGEPHLNERFSAEMRSEFKDFLRFSKLTVDITGELGNSKPPCFSVEVWGFNGDFGCTDVNLNQLMRFSFSKLKPIPPHFNGLEPPDRDQVDAITSAVRVDEPDALRIAASCEKVVDWFNNSEKCRLPTKTQRKAGEPHFGFDGVNKAVLRKKSEGAAQNHCENKNPGRESVRHAHVLKQSVLSPSAPEFVPKATPPSIDPPAGTAQGTGVNEDQ